MYYITPEGRQVPPDEILEALTAGPKDLEELAMETAVEVRELFRKLSIYVQRGYVRREEAGIARPEAPSDIHHDMSDYLVGKRTPNWDETLR